MDLSRAGFAHTDVKNSNVMVTPPYTKSGDRMVGTWSRSHFCKVKLVDFGAAQGCDTVKAPRLLVFDKFVVTLVQQESIHNSVVVA